MEHLLLSSLYVRYFTYLIYFKIQQRKCYFLSIKILLFLSTYYYFLNLLMGIMRLREVKEIAQGHSQQAGIGSQVQPL